MPAAIGLRDHEVRRLKRGVGSPGLNTVHLTAHEADLTHRGEFHTAVRASDQAPRRGGDCAGLQVDRGGMSAMRKNGGDEQAKQEGAMFHMEPCCSLISMIVAGESPLTSVFCSAINVMCFASSSKIRP